MSGPNLALVRIVAIVAAAAAAAACSGPDYPRFGGNSYRVEGLTTTPDGETTHTIVYRDGAMMRVETTLPELGLSTIVFDQDDGGAYVLNPAGFAPSGVVRAEAAYAPTGAVGPSALSVVTPPGIAVRIDDADAPQPLETTWAALGADNVRSTGRCIVAGERGREWEPRTQTAGVERSACITADGIVLRVEENGQALWEATSLQRTDQAPELFGVPAGYRMVEQRNVASRSAVVVPSALDQSPPPPG